MNPSKNIPEPWISAAAVVGLTTLWGVLRLNLINELFFPLTYVLPLLVCVWTCRRWHLAAMTAAFAVMAFVEILWLLPPNAASDLQRWTSLMATLANILIGSLVIYFIIALRDNLERRSQTILAQNAELNTQAEELSHQNEEIRAQSEELAQQSEEIESQAEEMERQNEELQENNDRLTRREAMLHTVLEMSRSSTGADTALDEVCRRALEIIGPPAEALAVLELDGEQALILRAQARHETQPPLRQSWPLSDSLAQVVLREQRSAYVDDLRQRADLAEPLGSVETIRSLLATPLRVGGDVRGVVVACARQVSHWTSEQFRLIEWIAAQCGLIVEALRWQRQLEERAREVEAANRSKDQFLAMLSHELRTPLTPVLAAAAALEADARLPDDARQDLAVIRRNVSIQSRLIDDLLDLTRVGRGKLELHLEILNVAALLRDAAGIVAPELDAREQTLTVQAELPENCSVQGDGARLHQVFWNLLKNAIKFSPRRGRITLEARCIDGDNPRVCVSIVDKGIGISPADIERIFRPFEQATLSAQRAPVSPQGLGLGLCIAKAIVDRHGGSVRAASEGQGRGATFTVELPLATAPATPAPTAAPIAASASDAGVEPTAARILLVEDHEDTGKMLARLLKSDGHLVRHVSDICAAKAAMDAAMYDLVVSDLGLPDGSGLDLARWIRADKPDLPAICLSGFGMDSDVQATRDAGFSEHLTKPIDLGQLRAVIARTIRRGACGAEKPQCAAS